MKKAPVITTRYARRLLVVWLIALLAITLYPLGFLHLRTVPRAWLWTAIRSDALLEFLANIAFFMPVGLLARSARLPWWLAAAGGLALSVAIESSQAWIRWRFPTFTDVVANFAGVLLGLVFATPILTRRKRLLTPASCALLFLAGLTFAIAIARTEIRFLRFGWSFPFGLAAVGAVLARGFARARWAIVIASAGAIAVAWVQPDPPGLTTVATILGGATLGVWPAYQADRARDSA